jgi:transaldolase
MTAMEMLHQEGQSVWVDGISREALATGSIGRAIHDGAVTGAVVNVPALHRAIERESLYRQAIVDKSRQGKSTGDTLFELVVEDAVWAADLLRPSWERTHFVEGWVSAPVSPLVWHDTSAILAAAIDLHRGAVRSNLLIQIPGTEAGLAAVEQAIFAGIPVDVVLLFSAAQYRRAAEAFLRGLERRVAARLSPEVGSVATMSLARWSLASFARPRESSGDLAIGIGNQAYAAYRAVLRSPRWQRLFGKGSRPQRLLWASAKRTDRDAPEFAYARALAAPFTINGMSRGALELLAGRELLYSVLNAAPGAIRRAPAVPPPGTSPAEIEAVAARLQQDAIAAARNKWLAMLETIASSRDIFHKAS